MFIHKCLQMIFKIACGIGIWQLLVLTLGLPNYFLPSPWEVACTFKENHGLIVTNAMATIIQIIISLGVSVVGGVVIGLTLDLLPALRKWVQPTLTTLQATPTFVLLPILTIWFGFGLLPKILVVSISACFTISLCFLDALQRTPKGFLELAQVMGAKRMTTEYLIRWPAGLQGLMSGVKLASIHIPLMVLATDWHGASEGLGYLIMASHSRMATDLMFCCLFCIIFITLGLGASIKWLQSKLLFWPVV